MSHTYSTNFRLILAHNLVEMQVKQRYEKQNSSPPFQLNNNNISKRITIKYNVYYFATGVISENIICFFIFSKQRPKKCKNLNTNRKKYHFSQKFSMRMNHLTAKFLQITF